MRLQRYGFFWNHQTFSQFFFKKSTLQFISFTKTAFLLHFKAKKSAFSYFFDVCLIHPVFIILISKLAQYFHFFVGMNDANGGMRDAIKGVCLHCCVVKHVLENHILTDLQLMIELPITHKITTQAAVASQSVDMITIGCTFKIAVRMPLFSTTSTTCETKAPVCQPKALPGSMMTWR